MKLLTQNLTVPGSDSPISPIHFKGPLVGIENVADVINTVTKFLFPLAGLLLFLYLAWGGFNFLLSQGDKEKVASGKAKITAAIIGFILLMLSFVFVKIIGVILGLNSGSSIF